MDGFAYCLFSALPPLVFSLWLMFPSDLFISPTPTLQACFSECTPACRQFSLNQKTGNFLFFLLTHFFLFEDICFVGFLKSNTCMGRKKEKSFTNSSLHSSPLFPSTISLCLFQREKGRGARVLQFLMPQNWKFSADTDDLL